MPITLNGTTGVVTPGATVGSITGILKATSGVVSQAVAGSDYGQLTLATAQTASGTAVDFTGIPSWAKRITVMFSGVSCDTSSDILVQVGSSGGIEITGYVSGSASLVNSTSGYIVRLGAPTREINGAISISKLNLNTWISNHAVNIGTTNDASGGGTKTISSTLDRVRITTAGGTSLFDAGTINISYE